MTVDVLEKIDEVAGDDVMANAALWEGDTGALGLGARKALTQLFASPFIFADDDPDMWSVMMCNMPVLQSRLNDLGLDLKVNPETGVAFTVQVDDASDLGMRRLQRTDSPSFSRARAALLVFLRERLLLRESENDEYVYLHELVEWMLSTGPYFGSQDHDKTTKRVVGAMRSFAKYGLVKPVSDEEDCWRILPSLGAWMTLEFVQAEAERLAAEALDGHTVQDVIARDEEGE